MNFIQHHAVITPSCNDLLRAFWDSEETKPSSSPYTAEELAAIMHFQRTHATLSTGLFEVQLPKRESSTPLGESRQQAVRRFFYNENNLINKGALQPFFVKEYFTLGHAEEVPTKDLLKLPAEVFCLPMQCMVLSSQTALQLN